MLDIAKKKRKKKPSSVHSDCDVYRVTIMLSRVPSKDSSRPHYIIIWFVILFMEQGKQEIFKTFGLLVEKEKTASFIREASKGLKLLTSNMQCH